MEDKKRYYKLDEIGFIGTQDRTPAQVKKDIEMTIRFIEAKKNGKPFVLPKKAKKRSSKTK